VALNNLGLGFLFTAKDLASGVMKDVKGHLLEVGDEGERVAKSLGSSFKQFGAGLGLMGVGLEWLEHLEPAVDAASDFEKAMKLVQSRVTEAEFPLQDMTEIVDSLSAKFGIMPADEAKAMYEGVAAGARDAASSQALLAASSALAVGTQSDLHESLATVSQTAKVFNIALKDSAQVADSLFVASKHVEGGVQGMTMMLEHLGPTAASAGLTMDELLGTIAQMGAAGIRGRPAMAGLKSILDSLIKPTQDARGEAARLGIAFDEATIKSEGLPAILAQITESGRMNAHTLEKLFGNTEAATVAMGLMRNGGQDLDRMMTELGQSTGAAADAAAKLVTAQARFKVLQEQVETFIGEAILPLKKLIFETLNKILEGFLKVNPDVLKFFTLFLTGVAVLATVVGAAMALSAAFTILSTIAGVLGVSFAGTALSIWAALWPVLVVAGLVSLAILGLKIAFDNNFGGIADTAQRVWEDLKLVFTSLNELFSGGGFTEDTWQKLEKHSGIRDFAISVFGWVTRIENFFSHIGTAFESNLDIVRPMLTLIGTAIDQVVDAFGMLSGPQGADGAATAFDSFGTAGEILGDILTGVFYGVLAVISWVIAAIHTGVAVVVGVVDSIKSIFSGLIDFFYGFFEFFAELLQGHWGKAWHGAKMMVFGIVDAIVGVLTSLVGIVGGTVDAIAGAFGQKTHVQKSISDFRDFTHNEMAKHFGVADGTGLRTIVGQSDSGMGGVAVGDIAGRRANPLASGLEPATSSTSANAAPWPVAGASGGDVASMPAVAALVASGGASEGGTADLSAMSSHLEQISKNTEGGGAPVNVTVMLDSEAIGKAVSKAKRNDETRNFTPAPVPG
jgi:TP901 family phage tail tape measure protein